MSKYDFTIEDLKNRFEGFAIVLRCVDQYGDLLLDDDNYSEYSGCLVESAHVEDGGYINVYLKPAIDF